jgi:hypothetical protein
MARIYIYIYLVRIYLEIYMFNSASRIYYHKLSFIKSSQFIIFGRFRIIILISLQNGKTNSRT